MQTAMRASLPPAVISPGLGASVQGYERRLALRTALYVSLTVLLVLTMTVAFVVIPQAQQIYAGMLLLALIGLAVWRWPYLALYLLLIGAATFESYALNFPDSLTDKVPFFRNVSEFGLKVNVPFTVAEMLFGWALVVTVLRRMADRQAPLRAGPLFAPLAVYVAAVGAGLLHGLSTGGDFNIALWEVRAQFYLLIVYLLALNVIENRAQIKRLMVAFLIAVAFKGVLGTWRFLVTLDGNLSRITEVSRANSLMSHEESLFFALWLVFGLALFLFRSDRGQARLVMYCAPVVLLAFLANDRRAGVVALLLAVMVVAALGFIALPGRRRLIAYATVAVFLLLPFYVAVFGGRDGLFAQPARAIESAYRPGDKDAASNAYRVLESENLKIGISNAPLLGTGYGKPIELHIYVPNLKGIFNFWDYIPHNTVLWTWMNTGYIGYVALWFLVGRAIIYSCLAVKNLRDPYFRSIAAMTVASVVGWVVIGALDMGLVDFRSAVLVGALLAITVKASDIERTDVERPYARKGVGRVDRLSTG